MMEFDQSKRIAAQNFVVIWISSSWTTNNQLTTNNLVGQLTHHNAQSGLCLLHISGDSGQRMMIIIIIIKTTSF